ncbi:MAG: 3-hydroxyacyl-CoA dehydrogenase NAD-binding domain-containing protein, partial [Paracoccus sp. (in: a-proteobacteria)]|nr:3-hydroxyacyl-CoA dehydrogenase NAD-binding domain-containing protein [Paracoccus sp. (in: a-proteobacteria)]
MSAKVTYSREGEIGLIEIDNPPVNALSQAVRAGLMAALEEFAADEGARIGVLLAKGRSFVAGADMTEFGKPPQPPFLPDVISALEASDKPIVAALHGTPLGGGLELALGASWRTALRGTSMGLPEVTIGVMPGAGGTQRLPRLIGFEKAIEVITSGKRVSADEALSLGLIDEISTEQDARAAGLAFARARLAAGDLSPRRIAEMDAPARPDDLEARRAELARAHPGEIAQITAFDAAVSGLDRPFDEGMNIERQGFLSLIESPQRAALIHAFFAERRAAQQPDLKGITPREIARIGVIGGGTMGAGIAVSALLAGYDVTLIERDEDSAARAAGTVSNILDGSVKRGAISADRQADILGSKFRARADYADLAEADLVIEAVFEKLDVKREVFEKLDRHCRKGAILATNTSYLDVAEIARTTSRPEDVIGLHFFSPAHIMKLLEIIAPDGTAPDVTATAFALAKKLRKVPVRAGNCDGFIGNRMLMVYRAAAEHMVLDGASPYAVDEALRDFGFAMGPFQVSDLAGLDIAYLNRQHKAPARHKDERVPVFADRMVEAGRLGRKSGHGYYIYDEAAPKGRPDPEMEGFLAEIRGELGLTPREFTPDEIRERYLAAMINEAAKLLGEGIAIRPSDVDVVLLYGYGFPRRRGGPLHYADEVGPAKILAQIENYAKEDPHFW